LRNFGIPFQTRKQLATIRTQGQLLPDTETEITCEARYGRQLQFSVRTHSASVLTWPREVQFRLDLDFLKLINRGL
jgi:hypothetical protein